MTHTVERLARRAHLFADIGQVQIAMQALSDIANELCLPVNMVFLSAEDSEEQTPLIPMVPTRPPRRR